MLSKTAQNAAYVAAIFLCASVAAATLQLFILLACALDDILFY